jgi:arylformamidase
MPVSRRAALLGLTAAALPMPVLAQARLRDRLQRRGTSGRSAVAPEQSFSFGPDPLQTYDLYADRGSGPILLFVHGGGWSRGERSMVSELPAYAARHGLTLASTSYRLAPAVSARESAMDVAAAVADLKRRLPGRPVFLLGHSAGAHLVILLDGAAYDATVPQTSDRLGAWMGETFDRAFGDQAAALSPTLRVQPSPVSGRPYPPFLIFHVARRQESADQSQGLGQALTRAGGRAQVIPAPDESHLTINRGFGVAGDPEGERAARFIAAGG